MTPKTKVALLISTGLVVLAGLMYFTSQAKHNDKRSIRIGANLPLSGPLATYGVAVREGASLGLETSQSPEDPQFAIDWQDNAGDPKTAVSILQRQLLSPPAIYISGVKPQTMAIKADIAAAGLPHFVWIFDAIINEGTSNTFRTWVSYKIEPSVYLEYARKRSAKRIAITYVQLPHTVDEFQRLVEPTLRNDGALLDVHPYEFGKTDFRDIAVKLSVFRPDLLILNGFQGDLVGLVRALRPLNLIADGNTIATYDLLDASKILGPQEVEGLRVVTPQFELQRNDSRVLDWEKRFNSKYGHRPLYTSAFAFDMMTAIKAAGKSVIDPNSHEQWISRLRASDLVGITGPIRFDGDGDMVTPLRVGVYRSGQLVEDK